MLPVEEVARATSDEKLAAVRVLSGVRHREHARLLVPDLEVLVGELGAVDRHHARAVVLRLMIKCS